MFETQIVVKVRLDGKLIGEIRQDTKTKQFSYYPKGAKHPGVEEFSTWWECLQFIK